MASEGGSRRILIDGTMARGGGGLTYLVNVIPRLARIAPNDAFRLPNAYSIARRLVEDWLYERFPI